MWCTLTVVRNQESRRQRLLFSAAMRLLMRFIEMDEVHMQHREFPGRRLGLERHISCFCSCVVSLPDTSPLCGFAPSGTSEMLCY